MKSNLKHWCSVQGKNVSKGAPTLVFCIVAAGAIWSFSQTGAAASDTPAAQTGASVVTRNSATAHPYPVMDPAKALVGSGLTDALRNGGLVLYLRHTETGAITEDCKISNLTASGEQEAVRVGQALRALKIPIGRVLSSDVCRVRDTARLLELGNVEIAEDLTNEVKRSGFDLHAARMARLAAPPPTGTNTLLVSHMHAGDRVEQAIYLDFGEIIVFRPDREGGSDAVARIRPQDWPGLRKALDGR